MFYYTHSIYILLTVLFDMEKYKIVHYLYIKAGLFSKNTKFKIIIKRIAKDFEKTNHNWSSFPFLFSFIMFGRLECNS